MSIADNIARDDATRGTRKAKADLDKRMPLGLKMNGDTGQLVVDANKIPDTPEAWNKILEANPYVSPETHEIDLFATADITTWDVTAWVDGEAETIQNHRCRVPVRLKRPGQRITQTKVDELTKLIRKRRPVTPPKTGEGWLVVNLADWQTGSADYGGTPALVERLNQTFDEITAMVAAGNYAGVALIDMGDICEQVSCFYDSQTYTVDLNLTEQIDLVIELLLKLIDMVAKHVPRVIFGAVPSNHGEFRIAKGTVATDRARDNIDLVIANAIARVLATNPKRYGHVEVWTPPTEGGDPYVLTLDLDGVMVGFMHGHQVTGMGASRIVSLEKWWLANQWSDRQRPSSETLPTAADCDIMVCGHGHTFIASQATSKLFVQCPAAASGSEWFSTMSGKRSTAGTLVFEVSVGHAMFADGFTIV